MQEKSEYEGDREEESRIVWRRGCKGSVMMAAPSEPYAYFVREIRCCRSCGAIRAISEPLSNHSKSTNADARQPSTPNPNLDGLKEGKWGYQSLNEAGNACSCKT